MEPIRIHPLSLLLGVGLAAGGLVLTGARRAPEPSAAPGETITAERVIAKSVVLLDDRGRSRAVLGLEEDGGAALQLYDDAGRVRLALSDGQPVLELEDVRRGTTGRVVPNRTSHQRNDGVHATLFVSDEEPGLRMGKGRDVLFSAP